MTGPAIRAILAVVVIILGMARITIRWRAFENVIGVALCALHADVRAGQREIGFRVVEGGRFPGSGAVTGTAIPAILSLVGILGCVTGITIRRGTFENIVDVTLCALYAYMRAGQREIGFRVVEGGRFPGSGPVTGSAILAKLSLVGILGSVAGVTALRRGLQVRDGAGPGMALRAGRPNVRAGQREGDAAVVKSLSVSIEPVVAGQAGITVSRQVV
jgi:hypothetical protein